MRHRRADRGDPRRTTPRSVTAVDPSEGFVAHARRNAADLAPSFLFGDAQDLPVEDASRDAVVSGLVLNFVPDRARALAEMRRVARPGGRIGFYVWDYPGGGVEFMHAFWTAAAGLDPAAGELAEDRRFPFCEPEALTRLAADAGIAGVACTPIETRSVFRDFDDFWRPFTLGAGPAPGYCVKLPADARERLRETLRSRLPAEGTAASRSGSRLGGGGPSAIAGRLRRRSAPRCGRSGRRHSRPGASAACRASAPRT